LLCEALTQQEPGVVAQVAGVGIFILKREFVALHQFSWPTRQQWPSDRVLIWIVLRADFHQWPFE
jgi:hypothetical protein